MSWTDSFCIDNLIIQYAHPILCPDNLLTDSYIYIYIYIHLLNVDCMLHDVFAVQCATWILYVFGLYITLKFYFMRIDA